MVHDSMHHCKFALAVLLTDCTTKDTKERHEREGHPQGGTIRWQWVAAMVAAPIMLGGAQWAKRGVFFDFDSTMMLELSWGKMVLWVGWICWNNVLNVILTKLWVFGRICKGSKNWGQQKSMDLSSCLLSQLWDEPILSLVSLQKHRYLIDLYQDSASSKSRRAGKGYVSSTSHVWLKQSANPLLWC